MDKTPRILPRYALFAAIITAPLWSIFFVIRGVSVGVSVLAVSSSLILMLGAYWFAGRKRIGAASANHTATTEGGSAEREGTSVYKKDVYRDGLKSAVLIAIICTIAQPVGQMLALGLAIGLAAICWGHLKSETRRMIVLSPISFEYRWPSGDVEKIGMSEIVRVEEAIATYTVFVWLARKPGIRLLLRSGKERTFPADFGPRDEILGRLRTLVANAEGLKSDGTGQ